MIFLFTYAVRAGEAMHIVVMLVVLLGSLKIKGRRKEDTVKPKREKRITGKQKIDVDTAEP